LVIDLFEERKSKKIKTKTFLKAEAILLVRVPATIITSDCLGEALNTIPNLSISYLEAAKRNYQTLQKILKKSKNQCASSQPHSTPTQRSSATKPPSSPNLQVDRPLTQQILCNRMRCMINLKVFQGSTQNLLYSSNLRGKNPTYFEAIHIQGCKNTLLMLELIPESHLRMPLSLFDRFCFEPQHKKSNFALLKGFHKLLIAKSIKTIQ